MCLPFLCGDNEDHRSRPNHDTQQWPPATPPRHHPPPDRGDDGYRYEPVVASSSPYKGANHGYGVGKNFGVADTAAQGRAPPAKPTEAYNSDLDMPASVVGFVRGRTAAPPQTPQRKEPRTVVPALTSGTPGKKEPNTHVDAGAWHHGPQLKEGATDTMQRAPVTQVARRDEDDDIASRYSKWRY